MIDIPKLAGRQVFFEDGQYVCVDTYGKTTHTGVGATKQEAIDNASDQESLEVIFSAKFDEVQS